MSAQTITSSTDAGTAIPEMHGHLPCRSYYPDPPDQDVVRRRALAWPLPPTWAQRFEDHGPGDGITYHRDVPIQQLPEMFARIDGEPVRRMLLRAYHSDPDDVSAPPEEGAESWVVLYSDADAACAGNEAIELDAAGAEALLRELATVLGYRVSRVRAVR